MARTLKPCGTPAAYKRHLYYDEEPCAACRAVVAAEMQARRDGSYAPKLVVPLQPCGTPAAYFRHRRNDEDACRPCLDAVAAYYRQWRAERRAA